MKMNGIRSLILVVWMGSLSFMHQSAMAQEKLHLPTLEDLIPGGETYRFTENLYGLQWWGDLCIRPEIEKVSAIDPRTGKAVELFTLEKINQALAQAGVRPLRSCQSLRTPWPKQFIAQLPAAYGFARYHWDTGKVEVRDDMPKEPAANYDYELTQHHLAYTVGNNLYVNGIRITNEPEGVLCGQSVHRNEFGISKGTFWSPNGNLLAFYRMDERMVTEYPLVDITARVGKVNNIRYPMAGMTSHKVEVGIYNPQTGKSLFLQTGDPTDRYFTNISWSPDEIGRAHV